MAIGALGSALAGCQHALPGKPESAVTMAAAPASGSDVPADVAPAPIDWTSAGDCLGQLRLLHAAAGQGRLDDTHEPPFAVVPVAPATSLAWIQAPMVSLVADLPLRSYESQSAAAAATPCLLLVEPATDLRTAHRVLDFEAVASVYQSSVRSEKNPDYDAAQERVREARREAGKSGPGILRVGDPMLDLVGVLVGGVIATFGQVGDDDLDEALSDLKETPRSRDRPVYRAYEFERSTVRAGKEATIPIGLSDVRRGRVWRTQLRQREMRQFAVLEGLDPRDRDYEQHRAGAMSWPEFEHWQRQPPQLPLSALVAALLDPGGGAERPAPGDSQLVAAATSPLPAPDPVSVGHAEPFTGFPAIAAIEPGAGPDSEQRHGGPDRPPGAAADRLAPGAGRRGESDPPPRPRTTVAAPDSRSAGVVRLDAEIRGANGFYVRPRLVVTAADVVGSGSVIDVTTSDGEAVLGLVVLTDPVRNLALIHVPRAGPPMPLADGPGLGPSQTVQVIELAGDGPAHVISGALQAASPAGDTSGDPGPGAQLELADGAERTVAGAPVFLNNRVIGLVADQNAGPRRNVIGIADLEGLLESEALAALH